MIAQHQKIISRICKYSRNPISTSELDLSHAEIIYYALTYLIVFIHQMLSNKKLNCLLGKPNSFITLK